MKNFRALYCGLIMLMSVSAQAELFDLEGNVVPGTQGITLRAGVDLDAFDLSKVSLANTPISANVLNEEQVYSTASYRAGDLTGTTFRYGIGLFVAIPYEIDGWNLERQRLSNAVFEYADGANATFSEARLDRANFGYAELPNASFDTVNAFRADFFSSSLTNADFSNASLIGADLRDADLTDTRFAGAKLQNASLRFATGVTEDTFDSTVQYNQWSEFPNGFEPALANLTFVESPRGDVDGSGEVDENDINLLNSRIRRGNDTDYYSVDEFKDGYVVVDSRNDDMVFASGNIIGTVSSVHPVLVEYGVNGIQSFEGSTAESLDRFLAERRRIDFDNAEWLEPVFDLNSDAMIDGSDVEFLLDSILRIQPGDADLNGSVEFLDFLTLSANFGDFGGWGEGDFDGDGQIEFPDFLILSANFGTQTESAIPVPEPASLSSALLGCLGLLSLRKRATSQLVRNL